MRYLNKKAVNALLENKKDATFVECSASLSQGFHPLILGRFIVVRNSCDSNYHQGGPHMCKSEKLSGAYPSYTDMFKAKELLEAQFSVPYNFPLFRKTNIIPKKLIPFDKIFIAKEEDYDAFVHFFLPDVCFERIWKSPEKYISPLKKFAGCILPDFSLCNDFPYPLQLFNCYRNRVLGFIFSSNQIPVIMNVSFADYRTFDFCCNGIERGGLIATGSLGIMKNPENRATFISGLKYVIKKLNPSILLIYGFMSDVIKEICHNSNIELHVFTPKWDTTFITKEVIYG